MYYLYKAAVQWSGNSRLHILFLYDYIYVTYISQLYRSTT